MGVLVYDKPAASPAAGQQQIGFFGLITVEVGNGAQTYAYSFLP